MRLDKAKAIKKNVVRNNNNDDDDDGDNNTNNVQRSGSVLRASSLKRALSPDDAALDEYIAHIPLSAEFGELDKELLDAVERDVESNKCCNSFFLQFSIVHFFLSIFFWQIGNLSATSFLRERVPVRFFVLLFFEKRIVYLCSCCRRSWLTSAWREGES